MFKQITIIGIGLIGSSLARAIRKSNLTSRLVGADVSNDVVEEVQGLDLVDTMTANLEEAVREADLVVIAIPVGAVGAVLDRISGALKPGSIVTDVGSVKGRVADLFAAKLPVGVHGVPAHPIAGTERSGPSAGFAELFCNRWCILTPPASTDSTATEKVRSLWEAMGSKVEIMDAAHHDLVLGITSHLPHLIAFTIVGTATDLEEEMKSEVIKYSAGGFRDFTRIAASNPIMWRDVFLQNKQAVLDVLQRFGEDLSRLQKAIRKEEGEYLLEFFSKTQIIRQAIVESGQAE